MHMDSPPVQIDIEDFHKDTTNIFEEIENLLKSNKSLEIDSNRTTIFQNTFDDKHFYTTSNDKKSLEYASTVAPGLDFLPRCVTHDFLLPPPEETHSFNEDPLLFSVEQGELQPITSPFMVPGIYKKISTVPTTSATTEGALEHAEPCNVFISETESSGRILSTSDFHKFYACTNEIASIPRRVLLLEPMEVENNAESFVAKPAISVLQNNKLIPKQWDALSKLAYNILKLSHRDHIVIDRKRNEIVRTENGTNQKTIYRFLSSETLGINTPAQQQEQPGTTATNTSSLTINSAATTKPKTKGRPRKPAPDNLILENLTANPIGQQPQRKMKTPAQTTKPQTINSEIAPKQPEVRTRSGRIVRVVKQNSKPLPFGVENADVDADDPPEASAELMRSFLAELRDSDFRCSQAIATQITPTTISPPSMPLIKEDHSHVPVPLATSSPTDTAATKRRVPPESICPTCKKIFLGRRIQRHFAQHPEHMNVETSAVEPPSPPTPPPPAFVHHQHEPLADMTLFRFLIAKLQRSSQHLTEDQRADLFLAEINDLVKQLQLRSSRLIRNTSGLHFVSARASRVLGIPEGQYALDMAAIERAPPPETESISVDHQQGLMINFDASGSLAHAAPPSSLNTQRSLDYTALSMSLDDTLTDEAAQKLNLSAGGKLLPPSEESLLRAVDDLLVSDVGSMKKLMHPPMCSISNEASNAGRALLATSSLVPHYDHASDNAVEALTMKDTSNVVAQQQQQQQQVPPLLDLSVDYFQFNTN